jgi:hypothetical protein
MTDEEDVTERRWSGYSDYKEVASQLHKDINSAVEAYSHVDSKSAQNIGVTPQTAVRTRTEILRVAKRLHVEIERNQSIDGFPEIHEDWRGDDGYLNRLEDADFTQEVPSWLGSMVDDIIAAGWDLGYLKAGMEKPAEPESDAEQVKGMFE